MNALQNVRRASIATSRTLIVSNTDSAAPPAVSVVVRLALGAQIVLSLYAIRPYKPVIARNEAKTMPAIAQKVGLVSIVMCAKRMTRVMA